MYLILLQSKNKIKVTYFQRRPRLGFNFSLEAIFEDVRQQLSNKVEAKVELCSLYNDGVQTKFYNILEAAKRQSSSVNHITGEVHFLNLLMKKKTVVLTIHDCRFMERKKGLSKEFVRWLYLKLPIWKSKVVTANSETTKRDIIKYTGCSPDKITVIPIAINTIYQPSSKIFNTEKPNILHIGTGDNKNLLRLIEAISKINCQLTIVGKLKDVQRRHLKKYNIDYRNLHSLSQEEMFAQYQKCDILAFVSTFEGFGMPIIEANSVERVVMTSNVSAMPETAGKSALFVNPFSVEEIRMGVKQLINSPNLREKLIEKGKENKLRFQSKFIAEQYYRVYQKLEN